MRKGLLSLKIKIQQEGGSTIRIKMPHGIPTDHDYMLEPSFFEEGVG